MEVEKSGKILSNQTGNTNAERIIIINVSTKTEVKSEVMNELFILITLGQTMYQINSKKFLNSILFNCVNGSSFMNLLWMNKWSLLWCVSKL